MSDRPETPLSAAKRRLKKVKRELRELAMSRDYLEQAPDPHWRAMRLFKGKCFLHGYIQQQEEKLQLHLLFAQDAVDSLRQKKVSK